MSEPAAEYKVTPRAKPCPYCGNTSLVEWLAYFEAEPVPAAECDNCGLEGPVHVLNSLVKKGWHYPKGNDDLENMPAPGQIVVLFYEGEDGSPGGPVISTPIHAEGHHLDKDGKSIYCRTIRWHAIPEE